MHRTIQLTLFSRFLFFFVFVWCLFFPLVDPCHQYEALNSSDRNINYTESSNLFCDGYQLLSSPDAWYRFQGAAGTRLPNECPQTFRCHIQYPEHKSLF